MICPKYNCLLFRTNLFLVTRSENNCSSLLTSYGCNPINGSDLTTASQSVGRHFQNIKFLIINHPHTIVKLFLLLIPPQCPISNMLYSKSTTNDYVRSPHIATEKPKRGVSKSRNKDKINHKPLMIFIR